MNILYYLHSYPPASFVINEIHELDKLGHNIAVFCRTGEGEVHHNEANELSIPVRVSGIPSRIDVLKSGISIIQARNLPSGIKQAKKEVVKSHDKRECLDFIQNLPFSVDHIHVHFPIDTHSPAQSVAAQIGVSCTGTAHAYEIFEEERANTTVPLLEKLDRIIVPSMYNKRFIKDSFKVSTPIDYVPASIRISKFQPQGDGDKKRLLTVGRLVEKKGIVTAIRSIAEISKQYPELEYRIIGDGPHRDCIEEEISKLGVDDTVELLGRVSDEILIEELDKAGIFLLPCQMTVSGDRDALPVVLKEAMAMKTVCISTYISAVPELITDHENGLLVPERNSEALSKAIQEVIENDNIRRDLANKGRNTVENRHNIEIEADNLRQSFEKAQR